MTVNYVKKPEMTFIGLRKALPDTETVETVTL